MTSRFDVIGLDADDTLWHSEDTFHQVEGRFVELVGPYVPVGIDVAAALRATERAQLPIAGYGVKAFTLSMIQAAITVSEGRVPALVLGQLARPRHGHAHRARPPVARRARRARRPRRATTASC